MLELHTTATEAFLAGLESVVSRSCACSSSLYGWRRMTGRLLQRFCSAGGRTHIVLLWHPTHDACVICSTVCSSWPVLSQHWTPDRCRPDAKNAQYQAAIKQGDLILNRLQKLSRVVDMD